MFILGVDEFVPGFLGVLTKDVVIVRVEGHVVLVNVGIKLVCTKDLGDFHKLVVIVLALEEGFFLENHA